MFEEINAFIQGVGFPIAMCIILVWIVVHYLKGMGENMLLMSKTLDNVCGTLNRIADLQDGVGKGKGD